MRQARIERSAGRMRAFRIAYDGSKFRGFQRQPDVVTVEDVLFDALRALGAFDPGREAAARGSDGDGSTTAGNPATGNDSATVDPATASGPVTGDNSATGNTSVSGDSPTTGDGEAVRGPNRPPGYAAAGRTDAGVSALAQTVAFACPAWLTPRALNSELPASIRAWASADVASDFHATHDAVRREYTYYLHAPPKSGADSGSNDANTCHADGGSDGTDVDPGDTEAKAVPHVSRIDDERVRAALTTLSGRQDFHNLTPDEEGTVRDLTARVARDGDFLLLRVAADGFPREFVRRLVTLLREIGTGTAELAFVERVLDSAPLSGGMGVGPAPAEPLVLSGVTYPDCEFERDPDAVTSTAAAFSARQSEALSTARVTGSVCEGVSGDGDGAAQL